MTARLSAGFHPTDRLETVLVHLRAAIDAGKAHHHCVVIDADGDEAIWTTDLNHGCPALLIALLVAHGQDILYIPGRIVHHASKLYRGEGQQTPKTPP